MKVFFQSLFSPKNRNPYLQYIRYFFSGGTAFVIANALIMATLSGVFGRYEERVTWLFPFAALMLAFSIFLKQSE